LFENALYLWGAELQRCLTCNRRTAYFQGREIRLRDPEKPRRWTWVGWVAALIGVLATALVAYLALKHAYRV